MKMSFHPHADKTHFHMKGFARGLALKKRHKAIRKWPIWLQLILSLVNKCLFNLTHVTLAHKVYKVYSNGYKLLKKRRLNRLGWIHLQHTRTAVALARANFLLILAEKHKKIPTR